MMQKFLFAIPCSLIALYSNAGFAQTVSGKLGTEPTTAMIVPDSPTTEDEILFMLAADGVTHGTPVDSWPPLVETSSPFRLMQQAASSISV